MATTKRANMLPHVRTVCQRGKRLRAASSVVVLLMIVPVDITVNSLFFRVTARVAPTIHDLRWPDPLYGKGDPCGHPGIVWRGFHSSIKNSGPSSVGGTCISLVWACTSENGCGGASIFGASIKWPLPVLPLLLLPLNA